MSETTRTFGVSQIVRKRLAIRRFGVDSMTIELGNRELRTRLTRVAEAMLDTSPLGHSIANSFLTVTEDNFDSEGRPSWAGLSLVTLARRKSGKMLFNQVSCDAALPHVFQTMKLRLELMILKLRHSILVRSKVNMVSLQETGRFLGEIFLQDHFTNG